MTAITDLLTDTGILQFGRFAEGDDFAPFRLNFAFLPSYPDLLQLLADRAEKLLAGLHVDRLVCTGDSLPFGLAVGLRTNLPVIYSHSRGTTYDLVGAYDIGHPAVLLVNTVEADYTSQLLRAAQRVGLEIHTVIAIADVRNPQIQEIPIHNIISLEETITQLQQRGRLPKGQAEQVIDWIGQTMS